MIDEDAYEQDVNAQWLKLAHAESNDELKEVLNTWPVRENYIIREENENTSSDDYEQTKTDK
jgi:hypothetical protein